MFQRKWIVVCLSLAFLMMFSLGANAVSYKLPAWVDASIGWVPIKDDTGKEDWDFRYRDESKPIYLFSGTTYDLDVSNTGEEGNSVVYQVFNEMDKLEPIVQGMVSPKGAERTSIIIEKSGFYYVVLYSNTNHSFSPANASAKLGTLPKEEPQAPEAPEDLN